MVARNSKLKLLYVKTPIAHHIIDNLVADWDLFSDGCPVLFLDNKERAVSVCLTVPKIHSKVPNILGSRDEPTLYIAYHE